MMKAGVVLLAAGSSGRMGRPKLLLRWGETSIIGCQIEIWRTLGAGQIAVVCAAGDSAMRAELDRLKFSAKNRIVNDAPRRGMFSSVRCAAQWPGWDEELTHFAISLGDQPHLRVETLRALLASAATQSDKSCQPRWNGRYHHPVLLPKTVFLQLRDTRAATLKEFLGTRADDIAGCDVDDPGLDQDIDTPEDYEKVKSSSHPGPSASSEGERQRR